MGEEEGNMCTEDARQGRAMPYCLDLLHMGHGETLQVAWPKCVHSECGGTLLKGCKEEAHLAAAHNLYPQLIPMRQGSQQASGFCQPNLGGIQKPDLTQRSVASHLSLKRRGAMPERAGR